VFVVARKTKRPWVEFAVIVALAAVIGGVYFAWSKQKAPPSTVNRGPQPVQVDDSNKPNEKIIKKLLR
jgi:hypothetical protein